MKILIYFDLIVFDTNIHVCQNLYPLLMNRLYNNVTLYDLIHIESILKLPMNALHKLIHAIPINYTRSAISAQTLSIKTLMKHSCHLGSYFMHQSNIQTTFGRRSNLNIINLTHTLSSLRRAASITK